MVTTGAQIFGFGTPTSGRPDGALSLDGPVAGLAAGADGGGYWLVAPDGGVLAYGDAPFVGSAPGTAVGEPVVGIAAC